MNPLMELPIELPIELPMELPIELPMELPIELPIEFAAKLFVPIEFANVFAEIGLDNEFAVNVFVIVFPKELEPIELSTLIPNGSILWFGW